MGWGGVESKRDYVVVIEERFLRYASRRVRRSEREEKASARSGRNDKPWVHAHSFYVGLNLNPHPLEAKRVRHPNAGLIAPT